METIFVWFEIQSIQQSKDFEVSIRSEGAGYQVEEMVGVFEGL